MVRLQDGKHPGNVLVSISPSACFECGLALPPQTENAAPCPALPWTNPYRKQESRLSNQEPFQPHTRCANLQEQVQFVTCAAMCIINVNVVSYRAVYAVP